MAGENDTVGVLRRHPENIQMKSKSSPLTAFAKFTKAQLEEARNVPFSQVLTHVDAEHKLDETFKSRTINALRILVAYKGCGPHPAQGIKVPRSVPEKS